MERQLQYFRDGLRGADTPCARRRYDHARDHPGRDASPPDERVRRRQATDHPRKKHRERDRVVELVGPRGIHRAPLDLAAARTEQGVRERA